MKITFFTLLIFVVLISISTSCTKEFIPVEKSKVVVVRSKAYTDIDYSGNNISYIIKPDLSLIIEDTTAEYHYFASTSGKTSGGTEIGERITWYSNFPMSSDTIMRQLETNTDYFFLFIKNLSNTAYGPIVINYGNSDEKTENILSPNNGVTYSIGYYKTHYNTKIRLYDNNNSSSYITATAGVNFEFPNTNNQFVILEITSKGEVMVSYEKPVYSELIQAINRW